jgi:hypothetical protein
LKPKLQEYSYSLPEKCQLKESRDLLLIYETKKQRLSASRFACGFCRKSFRSERHLDLHFDNRHPNVTLPVS